MNLIHKKILRWEPGLIERSLLCIIFASFSCLYSTSQQKRFGNDESEAIECCTWWAFCIWGLAICFAVKSHGSYIFIFWEGEWILKILDTRCGFVEKSYGSWILNFYLSSRSYKAWIVIFVVGSWDLGSLLLGLLRDRMDIEYSTPDLAVESWGLGS